MTSSFNHIGIVGAGAWGTALAVSFMRSGHKVTLWARNPVLAQSLTQTHENTQYLKGIQLDPALAATAELAHISSCDVLILAMPAQYVRPMTKALRACELRRCPIIIAAKGIELTTHRLMSEIVTQELPEHPLFILSGPSFAKEIAQGLPAALTLASEHAGEDLARALSSSSMRLYTTDDIIGTQIGGSIKNVLAIACGIVAGRSLGENARAALMTRGLAEIIRLGTALGARTETLIGLSGLGDLVLTCSSPQSRNMSLGIALAQGKKIDELQKHPTGVAEGITTATAALGLAYRHGIDMPVVSAVDRVLRESSSIDDIIAELLSRPLRQEAA